MVKDYLEKFAIRAPLIPEKPSKNLKFIIVIPCFNEPHLSASIESLIKATQPPCDYEIIVVVNQEKSKVYENNLVAIEYLKKIQKEFTQIHLIEEIKLDAKSAGVGLARKIGMDEASRRLDKDGVIVCFDADSKVSENYLEALYEHFFIEFPNSTGASIRFEHPIDGPNSEKIIAYELYLHYQVIAQRYAGLPYAYHTVGSSMACRNAAYQKAGGMNKRKAGEDFYFLHKIIALGNFTELNACCVYPSDRESDRVPFGTGRAMLKLESGKDLKVEPFEAFDEIRVFLKNIEKLYLSESLSIPSTLNSFLEKEGFFSSMQKIKSNSPSFIHFKKQFFTWFSAFRNMKFGHYYASTHQWSTLETEFPKLNPNLGKSNKEILDNIRSCFLESKEI
jgi:glycosyltransferase involved in cell wall biosynthesis